MSIKFLLGKLWIPVVLGAGLVIQSDRGFDAVKETFGIDTNNHKQMKEVFNKLDKDKSGSISKEELRTGIKEAGLNIDETVLEAMMSVADEDKSGDISLEEFERGLKHQHKGAKFNPDVGHAVAAGASRARDAHVIDKVKAETHLEVPPKK